MAFYDIKSVDCSSLAISTCCGWPSTCPSRSFYFSTADSSNAWINLFLEASGLMMRIAYLADRGMNRLGLSGSCAIPLVCSFSCAVAGIMTTRSIKSPKQRLLTILLTPLMPCPARIPVYLLIIACFVPDTEFFGWIKLQSLVFLGVLMGGAIVGLAIAAMIASFTRKTASPLESSLMLELPSYRLPQARLLLRHLYLQAKSFSWRVGKIIFIASISLWCLTYFPLSSQQSPSLEPNYATQIATWIAPVFEPLGFDTNITAALIPSLAAREVFVSSLATMLAEQTSSTQSLVDVVRQNYFRSNWCHTTHLVHVCPPMFVYFRSN